ncbi:MAG: NUDIX hydrolase [Desulfobulbaceae bacterium]|nr:NUDIX hydrolase [Desulfobulbaceae bacterium]
MSQCSACGQTIPAYRNPVPTVDIIIALDGGIVLVKRKNPPCAWALPGGFVDYGESLEQAAVREALEETGLHVRLDRQFHTYSEPDRDPRQHTVSTVFLATAEGAPMAGDDAAEVAIFTEESLPALAFDHSRILEDYFAAQRAGARNEYPHPAGG